MEKCKTKKKKVNEVVTSNTKTKTISRKNSSTTKKSLENSKS